MGSACCAHDDDDEPVSNWEHVFSLVNSCHNNKKVNSLDKLRHPRSDAYSAQPVLLNKQQNWCSGAYLDCYQSK